MPRKNPKRIIPDDIFDPDKELSWYKLPMLQEYHDIERRVKREWETTVNIYRKSKKPKTPA